MSDAGGGGTGAKPDARPGASADGGPNAATEDIGRRAVHGAAWLGTGQMLRLLMSFGTQIVLARLLLPDDFGLFGMAYVAAEMAQLLIAFGLGSAIVQKQATRPELLTSCFWLNLGIGVVVGLGVLACSPLLASYFNRTEVMPLLIPLALNMLMGSAMVVPQALLMQRLQFREMTMAQTQGSLVASLVAIAGATAGLGVWALALQPLVGNLVTGGMMFRNARWRPTLNFDFNEVRPLLNFSANLLGHSLVDFVSRSLPVAVVGRRLGAESLGIYSMATGLTGAVVFQISSVIVRVLFPTLSALKDSPERLAAAWIKAASVIAILAWPLMAGAVAVAADLIPVVFGAKWQPSVAPFQILCCLMAVQAVATTASTVLLATGRADLQLRITLGGVLFYAAALWFGTNHGVVGAAAGYAAVGVTAQLVTATVACRQAKVSLRMVFNALAPLAWAALGTGLAMYLAAQRLSGMAMGLRLSLCIALGAVCYPALLWLLARAHTLVLVNYVRSNLSAR